MLAKSFIPFLLALTISVEGQRKFLAKTPQWERKCGHGYGTIYAQSKRIRIFLPKTDEELENSPGVKDLIDDLDVTFKKFLENDTLLVVRGADDYRYPEFSVINVATF